MADDRRRQELAGNRLMGRDTLGRPTFANADGVADCLHPLSERRHPTEDNPAEWCWECGLEGRFHSPVRAQSGPHFPGNHDGDYPGAHWPE